MIGIYHNRDLDGFTSGAIIKLKYPEATMIGYDYGNDLKSLNIPIDDAIIMADVSFPMEAMEELAASYELIWIDHHISAINDYIDYSENIGGDFCTAILEDGIAACEGTWKHLFPDEKMPLAVKLLGEYDTWRNGDERWDNMIIPFQFGMRLLCNSVEGFPTALFYDDKQVSEIIQQGKVVIKYQSQVNELQCKTSSFECEFEGLRAICLNGGGFNSNVFDSVYDESKHDIMMPFQWKKDKWTISLYTTKDKVDCSVIAKSKGGGGHKKAAGFQVQDIRDVFPWL